MLYSISWFPFCLELKFFHCSSTFFFFFRDDPPGQSVSIATQELLRLTETNSDGLPGLDPVKDLHIRDIELVEQFRSIQAMEQTFTSFQCINCPRFQEHVSVIQIFFYSTTSDININQLICIILMYTSHIT